MLAVRKCTWGPVKVRGHKAMIALVKKQICQEMKRDIAVTKFFKSSEKEELVIATPSEIEEEISEGEIPSNKMNRKEGQKDSDDNSAPLAKKRKKGEERKSGMSGGRA